MPRKSQGGQRSGSSGSAYSNRTDMQTQPVRVATGQAYGVAGQQEAAQRAVPLPSGGGAPAPMPTGPMPGELGALDRGTERPGEHVSTGLPIGPGAGPEAIGTPYDGDDTSIQLRALYSKFPNQDLADLIEIADLNRNG